MAAKVIRITEDMPVDPKTMFGQLIGYSDQIKQFIGVIILDDGNYKVVNTQMDLSELALCSAVLQRELFEQIEERKK